MARVTPEDMAIGASIRQRRIALGMSQSDLAERLGDLTFQQVQKYENGTNRISGSRIARCAEILGCSLGDLMGVISIPDVEPEDHTRRTIAKHLRRLDSHRLHAVLNLVKALERETR